ncbi:SGNH/GDSL hydrolase family protein [Sphingobium sp. CAP-1]|uniref:SGNH/GDSL hydrolase family protein n=1 Tax=Sphingobium sp. CAP-1 TaxID=2676077 RepID=UPI0012BB405E|nr:SGNH/GDSL hydrolase family protein [Sphingobium sp. CAP-1]QGP79988.1 hypothetical protein GL174_14100 [Sphingobium sp. CAP-1]
MQIGLSLSLTALRASGGTPTPTPTPGASATTFALAPAVHYHPASQSATLDGSSRLVSLADMQGLAALAAISGTTAPKQMTDGLGRKFLRFNGAEAAAIANALVLNNRQFTAMLVGRAHHGRNTLQFLNPRFATYTSASVNTRANSSIGYMRGTVTSSSAPFLQAGSPAGSTNATDAYKVVPGCQMQVMTVASRTTANGGTRLMINNDICDVAQQTTSVTGYIGAVVGAQAASADNTETPVTSVNNTFDLYELILWSGELTNAQVVAAAAAAVSNYAIAQLESQLVLAGDSITDGIATSLATSPAYCGNVASYLTDPGAEQIPSNVRVINHGESGNQISHLVTKRDATNSVFGAKYPGGATKNIVAVQIGRNDMSQSLGQQNSAMFYASLVALINTASTGYLQRGWKVVEVANIAGPTTAVTTNVIAGEDTIQKRIEAVRILVADTTNHVPNATFLTDCLAGTGQTYDGLLSVLHLYDVTVGGDTKFKTAADAQDTASGYYDSDFTHLRAEGCQLMATGGDTPAYGYGAIV